MMRHLCFFLLQFEAFVSALSNKPISERAYAHDKSNQTLLNVLNDNSKLETFVSNVSALLEEFEGSGAHQVLELTSNFSAEDEGPLFMSEDPNLFLDETTSQPPYEGPLRKQVISVAIRPSECAKFQKIIPEQRNLDDEASKHMEFYTSDTGGYINVTCLTSWPHQWLSTAHQFDPSTQIQWFDFLYEVESLNQQKDVDYTNFRHFSTLHLSNVSHADVGKYVCQTANSRNELSNAVVFGEELQPQVCETHPGRGLSRTVTEMMFLYVNDLDYPASIPISQSPKTVVAQIGSPVYIPCIPSHPDFQVTLKRKALNLNGWYEFQSDSGFLIGNVTDEAVGGVYECLFTSPYHFELKIIVNLFVEENKGNRTAQKNRDFYLTDEAANEGQMNEATFSSRPYLFLFPALYLLPLLI